MKRNVVIVAQIGATYIGTVIGAGFATGQEILQFFTVYGGWGVAGILISSLLFIWLGMKMMIVSHRIGAYSYQELNQHLFGKRVGMIINGFVLITLIGVTSVMVSGTGAIFSEQLGIPAQIGIIGTLLLTYMVMRYGLNGVFLVNSLVVPLMIAFTVLIAIKVGFSDGLFPSLFGSGLTGSEWPGWKWLVSACTYAAFNLAMAQAVLVPLGREIKSEGELKSGAMLGGLGLGLMLLTGHMAINSIMPDAMHMDIPIAAVLQTISALVVFGFLLVIYGEIFTTLIGNVFGIARQLQQWLHFSETTIIILILLISYAISQVGFSSLVTYLYPVFGYMGLVLLICLAIKRLPERL